MTYAVFLLPSAERELRKVPLRDRERIAVRIDAFAVDPRPHGSRKLQGTKDRYRVRVGDYRVLYRIDDSHRRLVVYAIGHRKDVYG